MAELAVQPAPSLGILDEKFEDWPWAGGDGDDETASVLSVSEILRRVWGGSRGQPTPSPCMGGSQGEYARYSSDDFYS
jgi:hypothetical protein